MKVLGRRTFIFAPKNESQMKAKLKKIRREGLTFGFTL